MININPLPLLAYKVGPNLFDLSSQMHNVSMRDQMHRGVTLAEALVAGKQFEGPNSSAQVLIVGAGVAGVAAAIVLARHKIEVQIIDSSANAPFVLQKQATQRYVGPYMYEWPLDVYKSQRLPPNPYSELAGWENGCEPPLRFETEKPEEPAKLAQAWEEQLQQAIAASAGLLKISVGVSSAQTNVDIKNWLVAQRSAFSQVLDFAKQSVTITGGTPWANSALFTNDFFPRFVILAIGMGAETNSLTGVNGTSTKYGVSFWGNDTWLRNQCGMRMPPSIAVLGGGDGALQDVLRALTMHKHPLDTWNLLAAQDSMGLFAGCQQTVLALEQQHAQISIWENFDPIRGSANQPLDKAYGDLAKRLAQFPRIVDLTLSLIREDVSRVTLYLRDSHFSKAYALNRFLVHLFEQCVKMKGASNLPLTFEILRKKVLKNAAKFGSQTILNFEDGTSQTVDLIAVRFGADQSKLPGTWLGLTKQDTANRQELAAIPLPLYLPPTK